MEIEVKDITGKASGKVKLSDDIFALEPRQDIIHRAITWQLNKRRAGTHDVKNRSEISRTGAKAYRQKGTGNARRGDKRVGVLRGGGRAFGPTPRSHETKLPKKIRALALKHALSAKKAAGEILVIDDTAKIEAKTSAFTKVLAALSLSNALFISAQSDSNNLLRASRNIPNIDVLPVAGLNVYDIIRRQNLVLTKSAIEAIEGRLK